MKKFALSQQALIGIAAGGRLSPSRAEASWAKHILETGFELYERKLPEGEGVAPGLFYPLKPKPQSNKQALFAAVADRRQRRPRGRRRAPGAARRRAAGAVLVRPGRRPPGGHDARATTRRSPPSPTARIRTAGSTSRGSTTAARRSPPRSAPACPSAFGDRRAQPPRPDPARHLAPRRPARAARPLRLLRAPCGVGSAGSTLRPFAGPFDVLRVTGPARRRRRRRALDLHVPPQLDRRRVDGAGHHAPAPQRRGAVPEHRRRAGGRLGAPARRPGRAGDRARGR